MKAAHIRKVRSRVHRAQDMLVGGDGIENRELWTGRMAIIIKQVRGRDVMKTMEARAAADAVWMLLADDIPGVCDALIEANQLISRQNRQIGAMYVILRDHGIELSQDEPMLSSDGHGG